jgi:hypothetical protein
VLNAISLLSLAGVKPAGCSLFRIANAWFF